MLTDERVIFLRRKLREEGDLDYQTYVTDYGVTARTISKALRGIFYKHLNDIEAPIKKPLGKVTVRKAVRQAYQEGASHSKILTTYGISSATLSAWVKDLPRRMTKPFLTREQYQRKRQEARTLYQAGKSCEEISAIITIHRLAVYRYCADLIQQRKTDRSFWTDTGKKAKLRREANDPHRLNDQKVIELRRLAAEAKRLDSQDWAIMFEVSARSVKDAVRGVTFKNLDLIAPPLKKGPDQRPPPYPKKRLTDEQILQRRQADAALYKKIAAENRYEAWVNAGRPDWGEMVYS